MNGHVADSDAGAVAFGENAPLGTFLVSIIDK